MAIFDSLAARLPAIDSRTIGQIDQEIFEELEFHIAMRTEENMGLGMSADVARSTALTQFGDFATVQQRCRRALLGERLMWQRVQMGLSIVLLGSVVFLALQLYNGQRANRESIDDITSALKRLTPPAAGSAVVAVEKKAAGAETSAAAADPSQSYPIAVKSDSAREFETLSVDFGKLKMSGSGILVVPISTEAGVTGAVLIGNGTYSYAPEAGREFKGHFHAAMLRFNPKDADAVIKLSAGKTVVDRGGAELAKAILGKVFGHCYHAGNEALIPPEKAIAADVFSREMGNVLFSGSDTEGAVYNFTSRKMLYEKKK